MNTIEVYVPSTNGKGISNDPDEVLKYRANHIAGWFARRSTGATIHWNTTGYYKAVDNGIIVEPVAIVRSFIDQDILDQVYELASYFRVVWQQESVLFVYNGTPHEIK